MRQYKNLETCKQIIENIYCNKCGKTLKIENEIVKEGVFAGDSSWGYFSDKDGESHQFDICEKCYDEFVGSFQIPVMIEEN